MEKIVKWGKYDKYYDYFIEKNYLMKWKSLKCLIGL